MSRDSRKPYAIPFSAAPFRNAAIYQHFIDTLSTFDTMFTKPSKQREAMKLSERIKQLRDAKGWTIRRFADELDKTPGYISRVEGRGEIPSPELLCEMAKLFGVRPEELFELAKQGQLKRVEEDIETRQQDALVLFRKGRK